MTDTFDIGSIKVEPTFDLNILHPLTNKPTTVWVTIESYNGERVKTLRRKLQNKRLQKGSRNRKLTAEEIDEETLQTACAVITGWRGLSLNGKELEFNDKNVRQIMEDPAFAWFARQVDEAAAEEANFIKA